MERRQQKRLLRWALVAAVPASWWLLAAARPSSLLPGVALVLQAGGEDPRGKAGDAQESEFGALRSQTMEKAQSQITSWEKTATEGRTVPGFGKKSSRLLTRTLETFDKQAGGDGQEERQQLDGEIQNKLHSIFLIQRSSVEEALYQRLKRELLRKMGRVKRELGVKEKLRLLHASMREYDRMAAELKPSFVENPERDRAERRLSELQWGILNTPEGMELQQRWKMDKMRKQPMRQSKGVSISLSPGMRLMMRPGGMGNLHFSSKRQVGPPHNPNEVSIGLLNDGNVVDIYRDKPAPPLIKFQPSVGVDLSFS